MRISGGDAGWGWRVLGRATGTWLGIVLMFGAWSGSAFATAPGTNGPIVFSSYGKIYTIQPDGSGLRPIVRADEEHKYDWYPSWSPDGLRIVTSGEMREPDGYWTNTGLQVFSPEGTGFAHLPIFGFLGDPAWSPDGARILFTREFELFSTTPDGAPPTLVESDALSPAWSPDGRKIVFIRRDGDLYFGDSGLYTMNASGGGVQKVADLPGLVMSPSWSPDGSTIVFTYMAREARSNPGPGQLPYTYSGPNVYAVSATGGEPVQLTESGTDKDPVWSPDGSMIAFQSDRHSAPPVTAPDLYLMDADGSHERRLTTIHCLQCGPDWASLPPHSRPSAPAATRGAEPLRKQRFHNLSMRTRFARPSRVWIRFRAEVAGKIDLTIRRAVAPGRAFRCRMEPGGCPLTVRGDRAAREGFNRISLKGLIGRTVTPGRYWLELRSSSDDAHAGLVFRVVRPLDGHRRDSSGGSAGEQRSG